jgi:membrane-associated protease RseP (regulator of RpoE activity)
VLDSTSLRHRLLWALAITFATATIAYSALWMYYVRSLVPKTRVGITYDSRPTPGKVQGIKINAIEPGGPAEQAGLKVGDRIIAINGRSFESAKDPIVETVVRGAPGDSVRFTVAHLQTSPWTSRSAHQDG